MHYSHEDHEIICSEYGCASEHSAGVVLNALETLAGKLHAIFEAQCNGIGHAHADDVARLADQLIGEARNLANEAWGAVLHINSDPRGNPIGLRLPSGRSNNMGGEDWRLDAPRPINWDMWNDACEAGSY
jgi:hypothetical protein